MLVKFFFPSIPPPPPPPKSFDIPGTDTAVRARVQCSKPRKRITEWQNRKSSVRLKKDNVGVNYRFEQSSVVVKGGSTRHIKEDNVF